MQENNFWCLRNQCENTFSKLQIFVFFYIYKKKGSKHVRVLTVCNIQKNIFYIFFVKNTNITFNHNKKTHVNQILKALINQLLNPKKYIETCSYIFTDNTTGFYLSFRYLII
jgi:hypothetical protein